jgi:hypothetical protein
VKKIDSVGRNRAGVATNVISSEVEKSLTISVFDSLVSTETFRDVSTLLDMTEEVERVLRTRLSRWDNAIHQFELKARLEPPCHPESRAGGMRDLPKAG